MHCFHYLLSSSSEFSLVSTCSCQLRSRRSLALSSRTPYDLCGYRMTLPLGCANPDESWGNERSKFTKLFFSGSQSWMQKSADDLQIAIQLGNSAVVISCFVPKFNHQIPIGIQRLKHLLTFTSSFLHSSRTKNIKWWVSPVPAHHFFRVFLNVRHNSHGSDPAESSCTTSEQSSAFPNYGKRSQPHRMNRLLVCHRVTC